MVRDTRQTPRRPLIGVTGNNRSWSPSWFCIQLAVRLAGGEPRRISVTRTTDPEALDGVIVSGGDDIHPSLYGEEPAPSAFYDRERDELEQRYISAALADNKPLLGICRGYQLINVVLGGSLHVDIREMRNLTLNRRGLLATKRVNVEPASRLHRVMATEQFRVNSLHFQAIDDVAEELQAVAWDRDGIIQAVESSSRPLMGVQWHPEYLFYLGRQRRLFRWLVDAACQGEMSSP